MIMFKSLEGSSSKHAGRIVRKKGLIAKGATAQQAQEFLGHEDITTTMNIYTRCFNETKRHTSEIMNSIYADLNLCALDALLDAFHDH